MIYSRNSPVLGDVCSPALGLLVPECNVALALHVNSATLVTTSRLSEFLL